MILRRGFSLVVVSTLVACGAKAEDGGGADAAAAPAATCTAGGVSFSGQDYFPATNGCTMCQCIVTTGADAGTPWCEGTRCSGQVPATCTHGGNTFAAGTYFPAGDGCNVCVCGHVDDAGSSSVHCSTKQC